MDKEIKNVSILQLSYGNYVLLDDYIDLQQRIEKAVEILERHTRYSTEELLNILKGDDTNE